ncbi:MAG: protein kinase UbiB [Methanonatronarchaeales archaeon]|nr:protein kinase UbiB [Methanonatronarchaeales archaeon]
MDRLGEAERLARIGEVFARQGIGYLMGRQGKEEGEVDTASKRRARAVAVRNAFEELGPSFMKLGQLISNRPDVIAPEYVEEFSMLRRRAPQVPFENVAAVIEAEVGPVDGVFDNFEEEPIAAASIGQVHRAVLDGEEVVVKVQRPGIQGSIEADFKILKDFLGFFRSLMISRIPQEPIEVVSELERDMEKQLDYTVEGRNCERIRRILRETEGIRIPRVYWKYTTGRVLVQEYMEGEVLEDVIDSGDVGRYDRSGLARRFVKAYFEMIFEHGFFHADPHPANIILQDDTIVLVDHGSAGRLTDELRRMSVAFYLAAIEDYADIAAEIILEISEGDTDRAQLEWDLEQFIDLIYLPLRTTFLTKDLPVIFASHGLIVPRELILVNRSIDAMTGIAMDVYPDVSLRELMEPFIEEVTYREMGPAGILGRTMTRLVEAEEAVGKLPGLLERTVEEVAEGELEVGFRHHGLQGVIEEVDRATSRLSYSLIVSAIVLASSVVTLADIGPTFMGTPLLGAVGFLLAAVMGVGLLVSIWRYGKLF